MALAWESPPLRPPEIGPRKVYWIEIKNGVETALAEDQLTHNVSTSRVIDAQSHIIRFKAIYPTEIRTIGIPFILTVSPSRASMRLIFRAQARELQAKPAAEFPELKVTIADSF